MNAAAGSQRNFIRRSFDLTGKVAVVTGGTGVLGGAMSAGLAQAGARVAVLGRDRQRAERIAASLTADGCESLALSADVLSREALGRARDDVLDRWGKVDILVNAAGGNLPQATVAPGADFFGLPEAGLRQVVDLNLMGTLLPCQIFGEPMAAAGEGSIINISSVSAQHPLTRVVGYGAAKAAVESLTRWLAMELARRHGPGLRVNAIAPGFFIGEQNRSLLLNDDGTPSRRGRAILEHTPAGRFGEPRDLVGAVVWLASPAASFVNGAVVPIDGGFGAYSGI